MFINEGQRIFEDVDLPTKLSSGDAVGEDQPLPNRTDVITYSQFLSHTGLNPLISSPVEEQQVLECYGDDISCIIEVRDANVTVHDNNLDSEKTQATHSSSTCSLVAEGIENNVQDESAHGYNDRGNEQKQRPQMQPQPTSETESENSAAFEDDVKVCDICGDAGQDELLAICSRCSDGAEHTYCMRIMLDKLPEGDWLCEECKLEEETKNQKVDKLNTSDPKILSKLVTNTMDQETRWATKEPGSTPISDKRHACNAEASSMTSRKASETNGRSKETSIPREKTGFSHEGPSSNLDMEKIEPSANSSQPLARSQACPVSNSSNIQAGLQSSRGPLSKSVSFNNLSMKPKVKQLTGNIPCMQKMISETAPRNIRKLELIRNMTKFTSFKGISESASILRMNSTTVDRSCSEADTVPGYGTHQVLESLHQDDKTKGPAFFRSSKQAVSGGTQILRCQNCNETGHSTQSCSVDKFQKSSQKPSADRNLKEGTAGSNKCNDAVEATRSKTKIQNSSRLANQSEKLLVVKPSMQIIPDQASALANPLRASIIPELDLLWQGGFELLKAGRYSELCDGIQAHLSTCASTKVLEVTNNFPCIIQVDEVPRLSLWPSKFQGNSPKEDNIALFFFAKDIESYEKNYRNLLENMLLNDLALKGNIGGVELLIFPSNTLPENSQRWNRLFFLWGVFRGTLEKPGGFTLNVEPLTAPFTSELSSSPNLNSTENQDKKLSMCDESEPSKCMDVHPMLSSGTEDRICHTQESHQSQNNFCIDSDGGKDASRGHSSASLNVKKGAEAIRSEEQRSIEGETVFDTDQGEDLMEIDCLNWESSFERKHAPSDGTSESTGETMQCSNKANLDDNAHDEREIPGGSTSAERHFFLVDAKRDDVIYVVSSDDEGSPESDIPDLELALGGEKIGKMSGQEKLPGFSVDDRDDGLASLSLSLAFPAAGGGE